MKTYQQKGSNTLLIINHRTSRKVLLNNVVLLKGNINYTTIYMDNNIQKVIAHPIKFFETHLETHGFLRVHRAYMINPNHVKGYNQESRELMMSNGEQAIISRRREYIAKKFIA